MPEPRRNRVATSFRLDPRHKRVLLSLQDRLSRRDGTNYSQAQILERAIGCLWEREIGTELYEAFTEATGSRPSVSRRRKDKE